MQLKIRPNSPYKGDNLYEIECFSNGSFNLKVENSDKKYIYLCDPKGKTKEQKYLAETGVLLSDGCYILQGEPAKNNFPNSEIVFRGVNPKGTLYTKEGYVITEGFEEFKIFENGWYMLTFKENKQLFKANHSLVAEKFIDCEVFGNDCYAVRTNSVLYQTGTWDIHFIEDPKTINVQNVVKFLGNALYLVKGTDDTYTLYNLEKEICAQDIVAYKELADNKFSLNFSTGSTVMCNQSGKRISAIIEGDAVFLPDSTFLSYDGKLLSGRYRSDGILINEYVLNYEVAKHYYMAVKNSNTELFDKNTNKVEDNCFIVDQRDNFILLEQKKNYVLYNQNGKVFENAI